MAGTADRRGFVLVVPDGVPVHPDRPANFLRNPQVWNVGRGPLVVGERPHDDIDFLRTLLDELPRQVRADPRRIYVTGFSNGAAMTFRAGEELSERLAAIAPIAGYCLNPEPRPRRAVPTLYIVGDSDPLVPLLGGPVRSPWDGRVGQRPPVSATLDRWQRAIGCAEQPATDRDEGGVRVQEFPARPGGADMIVVTVAGLGHHWPGGHGRLKRSLAGMPSDRLNANEVIWKFFRRFTISG